MENVAPAQGAWSLHRKEKKILERKTPAGKET